MNRGNGSNKKEDRSGKSKPRSVVWCCFPRLKATGGGGDGGGDGSEGLPKVVDLERDGTLSL